MIPRSAFNLNRCHNITTRLTSINPIQRRLFGLTTNASFALLNGRGHIRLLSHPNHHRRLVNINFRNQRKCFNNRYVPTRRRNTTILLRTRGNLRVLPILVTLQLTTRRRGNIRRLFLHTLTGRTKRTRQTSPFNRIVSDDRRLKLHLRLR